MMLLLLLLLAAPPAAAQAPGYAWGGGACATIDDCSLGGECVASKCVCDNYFTGPQCDLLNLQRPRLDDQAGLCHAGFSSYFSWGGRSELGADGKYHLVASFMCRHATLDSWTTASSSAHFVSDTPDGAFDWADSSCAGDVCTPLVIPWSHNTVVAMNGEGLSPSILVAHIGDGVVDPSKWSPCFNKSEVGADARPHEARAEGEATVAAAAAAAAAAAVAGGDPRGVLARRGMGGNPGDTCYFHTADSWDGPWSRAFNNSGVSINCTGSWTADCLVGNPAPFVFPNGTVNLYFTATTCPKNSGNLAPPCIAMARSDSGFAGPYQLATPSRPITYPESEDPSVFRDKRGNFHLLTNVNTYHARCAQGVPCGGHAWSRDGYVFSNLTVGAFGPVITFKNGSEWRNAYVERPLVTMAPDGVTPLTFHVGMGRKSYADSCNWVQLLCTDGTDPTCGPTRFAPPAPPKNVTLRNGGRCLIIANASSFPCSGTGAMAGCPVLMGDCGDPSAQWQLSSTDGSVVSGVLPGVGLDVDCNSPTPHTVVKALASSFAPVAIAGDRLSVLGGAACFNTGQGPPRPVCGPPGEHTLDNQIQVMPCSDATTAGWSVVSPAAAGVAAPESKTSEDRPLGPTPPPALFFGFDAPFGDNMVLQRAPAMSAVYGYLDSASTTGVRVTVSDGATGAPLYSVDATLNATAQPYGAGWGARPCPKAVCPPYDMAPFTPFGVPLPTWKALLRPAPAGGNVTITAECTGCGAGAPTLRLTGVTFGDVWFCSGQSNMWLPVKNTFSRNESATRMGAGELSNIRVMAGGSGSVPYAAWPPQYAGGARPSNPWLTAAQAAPAGCVDAQNCPLFEVGATCFYTLQTLATLGVGVPLGLLDLAIGGQRIEEYASNASLAECTAGLNSQNIPWWNAQLYGQQTLMFTDMTVAGWLWYQGENNMGGQKGSSLANTGYSCAQRQLIRGWRAAWSRTPGTTDALAPFGVVTLASSGSEGGPDMGAMRLAQTAGYGVLPSPELPRTFLAQAYDLDDEWGPEAGPCWGLSYNRGPQWHCCAGPGSAYNATACAGREALCAPACAAQAGTAFAMSGIHPRSKLQVGERLGRAAYNSVPAYGGTGAFTGPTLAGCTVAGATLTVRFNATLLRGDTLALQRAPPLTPDGGGSQLYVQTNASLFCVEPACVVNATTGGCAHVDPHNPRSPVAYVCPTWAGGDGTTVLPAGVLDSGWTMLNFTAAPGDATAVVVDLAPLGGAAPTAVRYAWGVLDCCDHTDAGLYVTHGCVAACPLMSSSGLPANPFLARVVGGACECVAPQVCSG